MMKEVEGIVNQIITERMEKAYADWKKNQPPASAEDEIEKEYRNVTAALTPEQQEVITSYCNVIFNSGAETGEFYYRLGLKDGLKLKKLIKKAIEELS